MSGSSSTMDVLGKHRIAFNNMSIELFKELERELGPALKGVDDENKILKNCLEEEQNTVQELKTAGEEQKVTIEKQAMKIRELEANLVTTLEEKSRIQKKYKQLETADIRRHQRTLTITHDKSLENKENIPDLFPREILPQRPPERLSLAPKSRGPGNITRHTATDNSTQTETSCTHDLAIQTDDYDLTCRRGELQRELNKYRTAHATLMEKYRKNHATWKQWIESASGRVKTKKRSRGSSADAIMEREKHSCSTPETPIAAGSSSLSPPVLSPDQPRFDSNEESTAPKKGGLFDEFKGSMAGGVERKDILDVDIKEENQENDMPTLVSEKSNEGEWPSSIPETQTQPQISAVKPTNKKRKAVRISSVTRQQEDGDTTDEESELQARALTAANQTISADEPILPPLPPQIFKTPHLKKKHSGESEGTPVVIKSEPRSSSSEFAGYHIFEQESLDLDDIGEKPATPRKKRKILQSIQENAMREPEMEENGVRPGWLNGGFAIAPIEGAEDILDEDIPPTNGMDVEGESPVRNNTSAIQKAVAGQEMPSSPPPFFPKTTSSTPRISATKPLLHTSDGKARSLPPSRTGEKRLEGHRRAAAAALEDGTDGVRGISNDTEEDPHPPMVITERQKKKLESSERLNNVLNNPAPKTPSLEHLRKKPNTRSAPAKRPRGGDGFETPSSTMDTRQKGRKTDPLPMGKQAAVIQSKQKVHQTRSKGRLDVSDFRVNPTVNGGMNFAFQETVRNREARRCLPGCTKACCRELSAFTSAAGLPKVKSRAPRWRSSSLGPENEPVEEEPGSEDVAKEFVERFGKHRDAFPRRRSPPGFWEADFPDTQMVQRQHKEAEEVRLKKLKVMKKEAEKGDKGRFVYRD